MTSGTFKFLGVCQFQRVGLLETSLTQSTLNFECELPSRNFKDSEEGSGSPGLCDVLI